MTDPSVRLRDIQLGQCGLLKSKKKPQRIFFSNFDACHKMEKVLNNVSFIFKIGDDLRQVKQSNHYSCLKYHKTFIKGLLDDANARCHGGTLET